MSCGSCKDEPGPPTAGWCWLFPLGGRDPDRPHLQGAAVARARRDRHARDRLAFLERGRDAVQAADLGEEERQVVSVAWDYAKTVGVDAQLVDPDRPAVDADGLVVAGVSTLIHLYSVAYMGGDRGYTRFFAYLNFFVFSMLLLVLAANFFLLIIGWAFVGAASYLLISFWYRRKTATAAGIKAFVINVLGDVGLVLGTYFIFKGTGTLDFLRRSRRSTGVPRNQRRAGGRLHPAARRRVRQVRPGPAPHLAPGRHGGPDPGLRPDPRGDDGHRRRLPDRAPAPAVRAGAGRGRRRRGRRLRDAADRRHDRPRRDRPQARHRLLDDVADRLHDHGRRPRPPTRPACST